MKKPEEEGWAVWIKSRCEGVEKKEESTGM